MKDGILFAAPLVWDDVCFAVPAWRALVASGVVVTVVGPVEQGWFWEKLGARFEGFARGESARGLGKRLVGGGFGLVLLWEAGVVADAAERAGIEHRVGFAGGKKLEKRLTEVLPREVGAVRHRVQDFLAGVAALVSSRLDVVFFAPLEREMAVEFGCLVVVDSEVGGAFEWSVESWVEFWRGRPELEPIFVEPRWLKARKGGFLGRQIVERLGRGEVREILDLEEFFLMAQRAELVFGIEGAAVHLAALAGCRVATWFGPGEPEWRRPLGRRHLILREKVACGPCYLGKCPMDLRCQTRLLASVAVERVAEWQAANA